MLNNFESKFNTQFNMELLREKAMDALYSYLNDYTFMLNEFNCPITSLTECNIKYVNTSLYFNNSNMRKPFVRLTYNVIYIKDSKRKFIYVAEYNSKQEIVDDFFYEKR